MREEIELQNKLYGVYNAKCDRCKKIKHKTKFRRFNSNHKTCNDCFLVRGKENENS